MFSIFKIPSLPNRKSQGSEICTHYSPSPTCHVSHVICHMSCVTYHMSQVRYKKIYIFVGQRGEASRWGVCYERGHPRLFLFCFKLCFPRQAQDTRMLCLNSIIKCVNIAHVHPYLPRPGGRCSSALHCSGHQWNYC